jgi:large subunit ribosomal protein L13Ae
LAKLVGWTKKDVVERLEEKRKAKAAKYYQLKKKRDDAKTKAKDSKEVAKIREDLAKYGF